MSSRFPVPQRGGAAPRFVALVALAALVAQGRPAWGHVTGVSYGDVRVEGPPTRVEAHMVFALADVAALAPLDADGDGQVTAADLVRARWGLASFVDEGVVVEADGERCEGGFLAGALDDVDGLTVDGHYTCPSGARRVEITCFFVSTLGASGAPGASRGAVGGHRHALRVTSPALDGPGMVVTERLLQGPSRSVSITLPAAHQSLPSALQRLVPRVGRALLGFGSLALGALALTAVAPLLRKLGNVLGTLFRRRAQ